MSASEPELLNDSSRLFRLLQNAQVIGSIKSQDKLRTQHQEFTLDKYTFFTPISRLMNNESRYKNFDAVADVIRQLKTHFHALDDAVQEQKEQRALILDHLGYILTGLDVLTQTYNDDPRAVAKIQTTKKLVQTGMVETILLKNYTSKGPDCTPSPSDESLESSATRGGASTSSTSSKADVLPHP